MERERESDTGTERVRQRSTHTHTDSDREERESLGSTENLFQGVTDLFCRFWLPAQKKPMQREEEEEVLTARRATPFTLNNTRLRAHVLDKRPLRERLTLLTRNGQ